MARQALQSAAAASPHARRRRPSPPRAQVWGRRLGVLPSNGLEKKWFLNLPAGPLAPRKCQNLTVVVGQAVARGVLRRRRGVPLGGQGPAKHRPPRRVAVQASLTVVTAATAARLGRRRRSPHL